MRPKTNILSRGSRARDFILKLNSYCNRTVQGEITHVSSGQLFHFRSLLGMAFLIDERLEELGLPQRSVEMRSWQHPDLVKKEEVILADNTSDIESLKQVGGSEFLVRVLFRQNASWQGEVHWLDTNEKKYFRSFLELILLLQEAMDKTGNPRADYVFESWSDEDDGARENVR